MHRGKLPHVTILSLSVEHRRGNTRHAAISSRRVQREVWQRLLTVVLLLVGGLVAASLRAPAASATGSQPCDLLAAGNTACVGAYSSARAMYSSYNGPLYQVQRESDVQTTDIGLLAAGGYANAAAQDAFCAGTVCTVTKIYDQSPQHNDLTPGPVGAAGSTDTGVRADALPVTAGGHKVYGLLFDAGTGFRKMTGSGVATAGQPESMYAVLSGTHIAQQDRCCFDFGNGEITAADTGNGHMDALNISDHCTAEPCSGSGPWFQADFENATFMGSGLGINGYQNPNNISMGWNHPFLTGVLRNDGQHNFALDGGPSDAASLTSLYSGALPSNPSGYVPMKQEGGIVLGIGGDNSNAASGAFFEGVMTAGYASNTVVASVQTNIASVGYTGTTGGGTGEAAVNAATGKCLDVSGNDVGANGAAIDLWDCLHDAVDQSWTPTDGARLTNAPLRALGRCLDVPSGSTVAGTKVQLYDCNGNVAQNWTQQANGTLVNPNSGLCLTAPGATPGNGTLLDIEACTGSTAQQFRLEYPYQPVAAPGGKCLDVSGANSGGNGAAIDLWDCQREAADQYWLHNANGSLTTIGRCLDVPSGSAVAGTAVQLYDCNGNVAQVWVQQSNGSLLNPHSDLCLSDPGGTTANGTALVIDTCNGTANQKFVVASGQTVAGPGSTCLDADGNDQYGNWFGFGVFSRTCVPSEADQHWILHSDNTLRTLTRCLDINGNATASGTQVGLFNCNGVNGQQWIQRPDGTLLNPGSGLCLTQPGGNSANRLDIEACAGAANQQFAYLGVQSLAPSTALSLRSTTSCCTTSYVRHQNGVAKLSTITATNPSGDFSDASWTARSALNGTAGCVSFESKNYPGGYLRQSAGAVYQQQNDNTAQFKTDATFCPVVGNNGQGVSLKWAGNSALYLRHYNGSIYVASNGGADPWDGTTSWSDDTSWTVTPSWA